jgi:homoserine acetyltransferase
MLLNKQKKKNKPNLMDDPSYKIQKMSVDAGSGGTGSPKVDFDVEQLKLKFKLGMKELYDKKSKKTYNYLKNCLLSLNRKLDEYDNANKNKRDKNTYKTMSNLKQSYFLVDDIFDNYRSSEKTQIYTTEQNIEIANTLSIINKLKDLSWFEEILFSLGLL